MLGQPQPNLKAVVAQEHLAARPVRRLEFANSSEPEYVHVPGRTRVSVADRQTQMVDAADHLNDSRRFPVSSTERLHGVDHSVVPDKPEALRAASTGSRRDWGCRGMIAVTVMPDSLR